MLRFVRLAAWMLITGGAVMLASALVGARFFVVFDSGFSPVALSGEWAIVRFTVGLGGLGVGALAVVVTPRPHRYATLGRSAADPPRPVSLRANDGTYTVLVLVGAHCGLLTFGLVMMIAHLVWVKESFHEVLNGLICIGFLGLLVASGLAVIASVLWKLRWLARYGVEVTATARRFDPGRHGDWGTGKLTFSYEFDDRPFENSTAVKNPKGEQLAARQTTFTVLVNPNDPTECALIARLDR